MNTTYKAFRNDTANIIIAKSHCITFGRAINFSITVASRHAGDSTSTMITFGVEPQSKTPVGQFSVHYDGLFRFRIGQRIVEQNIVLPRADGILLESSILNEGADRAGRFVATAILRKWESIYEKMRQSVLVNVGNNIRQDFKKEIMKRFDKQSRTDFAKVLSNINWLLMFSKTDCGTTCQNVIDYALQHNPANLPQFDATDVKVDSIDHTVAFLSQDEIDALARQEQERQERLRRAIERHEEWEKQERIRQEQMFQANKKASQLLQMVCGSEMGDFFARNGYLRFKAHDYTFEIRPEQWVNVKDPYDRSASLCIHTQSFSCNPIDEVALAYLHIRNCFHEYMKTAVYHQVEKGFIVPVNVDSRKVMHQNAA